MFGNKKRIHELETANFNLNRRLEEWEKEGQALRNQIEYLVRTIRQTDDKIFAISQCTDWATMRPRIAQLTDEMTARKVAESNRIGDLIRPQLIDVYKK